MAASKSPGRFKQRNAIAPHSQQASARRKSIEEQRRALPITIARQKLVDEVHKNDTLVIIGETGSGKTTQLPQFLLRAGFSKRGKMIGITQPRRVAAVTVATRVAEEMGSELGREVGYSIRFEDATSDLTRIKYMTDGMLLREALLDPLLRKYGVIVIDEAHERTVHTDVLLGLLKGVQAKRTEEHGPKKEPLKLIVMSATLDAQGFSTFFNNAKIVYIQGRQFPVEIFYTFTSEADILDASLITLLQIHTEEEPGDILVFLTGQEEIESMDRLIHDRLPRLPPGSLKIQVVPIYAALPSEQQVKAFIPAPPGTRKVILATNIAETSVTIPGIRYVVDPGLVKSRSYNPRIGLESLIVVPVSKAQALQRSGRAGREGPGKCYRLYMEETFKQLENATVPEIKRCNLASVVLQLKALGIDDVLGFDFMDKPPKMAILKSLEHLYILGALTDEAKLSDPVGIQMARLPLEPLYAKALLISANFNCSKEMLSAVAMLSVESIFFVPKDKKKEADAAKQRFLSGDGDHITLVSVMRAFTDEVNKSGGGVVSKKQILRWCIENYINMRSLKRAVDIYRQIEGCIQAINLPVLSCGEDFTSFRRCLAAAFFLNAACLQQDGTYRTLANNQVVSVHPSSIMHGKKLDCVVFNELVKTNKQFIRNVTRIDSLWLPELAPHFYGTRDAVSACPVCESSSDDMILGCRLVQT
ncbi:hypothetical protein SELMODRAFT_101229 [Selaginella moellendorffii]|uniref:RNA helicase n=1 Tax=Selaginella moellendorffii TaxID=88036 RepID=D8RTS7_SELML|nr:hypothetical protein SELMODRAFT_101229 [Selaginella moellendorffii]